MKGTGNFTYRSGLRGLKWSKLYALETINLIRKAYLFVYLVIGMGLTLILGWMDSTREYADKPAYFAFIVCALLSYIFGARMLAAYGLFRRLLNKRWFELSSAKDVWYWKAFIAMWATTPLLALALLKPWEVGKTLHVFVVMFMLLHVVATTREASGKFWRKFYAFALVLPVAASVLLSIFFPAHYDRMRGYFHRSEALSRINEARDKVIADRLTPELQSLDSKIVELEVSRVKYYQNNSAPWPQETELERLKIHRAETEPRLVKNSTPQIVDEDTTDRKLPEGTGLYVMALIGALAVVFWPKNDHGSHR